MFIAYRVAQRNCKFYGLNWFDKNDNLMDLATIFFRLAPPPGKWKKNSVSACLMTGFVLVFNIK